MKRIYLIVFILLAVAQWIVPLNMLGEREDVLARGKTFRFRAAPADPEDPLRGRFISLNFEENSFPVNNIDKFSGFEKVYVILRTDDSGFAKITNVHTTRPSPNLDYVEASISGTITSSGNRHGVMIRYPFEEYYMEEFKAPKAEILYRDSLNRTNSYAEVNIYQGTAVLKGFYINGKRIEEVIR
jgi:uncharacterized membrane-anchored protein